MNRKKDTAYGINRLESKNARAAIIQKISADFNLTPIIAEAYYKQISDYFAQHADVKLTSGQICYEAIAAEEPAGKHIALAKKVSCRLTLNDTQVDLEVLVQLRTRWSQTAPNPAIDSRSLRPRCLAQLRGFSGLINQFSFNDETRHSRLEAGRVFRHDARGETRHGSRTLS